MKDIRIHFIYDYVDPGSYLAHELLARWRSELPEPPSVEWAPLELRVPSSSVLDPDDAGWQGMARFLEEEAAGEGVPIRAPRFIPWTRKAHELALHARQEGCFDAIHEAIFRAHFVDDRDIGRVDTLVKIAAEGGLDPGEVRTALGVDRFAPEIETRRKSLLSRGVRGVPTLEAAGRKLEGFPDVDGFRRFLGKVADEPGAPPDERKGRR